MNPSTLQAATDKVKALGGALEALSVENRRLREEVELYRSRHASVLIRLGEARAELEAAKAVVERARKAITEFRTLGAHYVMRLGGDLGLLGRATDNYDARSEK